LDQSSTFFEQSKTLFAEIISGKIKTYCGQQNIIEVERILIQRYKRKISETIPKMKILIKEFSFWVLTLFPYTIKTFHSLVPSIKPGGDFFDYYLAATMLDNGIDRISCSSCYPVKLKEGINMNVPFYTSTRGYVARKAEFDA